MRSPFHWPAHRPITGPEGQKCVPLWMHGLTEPGDVRNRPGVERVTTSSAIFRLSGQVLLTVCVAELLGDLPSDELFLVNFISFDRCDESDAPVLGEIFGPAPEDRVRIPKYRSPRVHDAGAGLTGYGGEQRHRGSAELHDVKSTQHRGGRYRVRHRSQPFRAPRRCAGKADPGAVGPRPGRRSRLGSTADHPGPQRRRAHSAARQPRAWRASDARAPAVGDRLRRRVKTTIPNQSGRRFPDLIQRDFTADEPDGRYVGDITYLPIADGSTLYLATVIDLCSRRLTGWQVVDHIPIEVVEDSLRLAAHTLGSLAAAVLHLGPWIFSHLQGLRKALQRRRGRPVHGRNRVNL